ncbi:MAG: hypothetical protein LC800_00245 [Acidobacteria bacterium]|nr:hypothetical protein [Acidobacteriota bacterium]
MSATVNEFFMLTRNTDSGLSSDLYRMLTLAGEASINALNKIALFKAFLESSASTGGYVQIQEELGCLPALIGNDDNPVYLYEFVEALDNAVDYDVLKEEFPTLSYAQINGAISFLRKVAQLNVRGVDIDALEDEADAHDSQLIEALRTALNDRETVRVLNND